MIGPEATLRILLVEDNDDDVAITRRVLAKSGVICRLDVAKDGDEALQLLAGSDGRKELPSLVLLDVGLPGISGLEVLRRMKQDALLRLVPVVILTGSRDRRQLEACIDLGPNLYLEKPVAIVDVVYMVLGVHKYWIATQTAPR
jgi:two-component system response regulator